ncbi:3-hydroxyacyl-CoA dehydrogenase NAD-binding domain-containing protein [Undibacterium cyanobacteriorum]|uniref:3-hydroxyacyl-CoA dehydrogenase NAD-binding domain-containing protein n=1 Tax=Undibacterium cyanobacteriorum TaxID=3073561 RepID=A0ABY9RCC2_9BURK|nr:3-hydroxyacyl-CoA dehydrogenase NAD-binding domain-containing protein [Undibacterium sp. 20NA77.5]WMW78906.1 3-hydroxyacyl-CoA dehydrogenase NAD-binding domain-containing protein [Undibacterium sp. 20NA77.5]
MTAHLEHHNSVAIIRIDNPPVNGIAHATRAAIAQHLQNALSDQLITAIIITGHGIAFSGGADIKEFGTEKTFADPALPALLNQIELASKPVIAVVNGVCMGGGLELALACHYRVGTSACQLALPEVKLGILPGAGGTQRLPRLLRMETCVDMITSGQVLDSSSLRGTPLFDFFVDDTKALLGSAIAFAEKVATVRPIPRVAERAVIVAEDPSLFEQKRLELQKKSPFLPAPKACLKVLEEGTQLSFAEGLQMERNAFQELLSSPESKALRHIFVAERAIGKVAGIDASTPTRAIAKVAVIGAGTMGAGIAMNFASAGIPVKILDLQEESLSKGLYRIRTSYQSSVSKGKLNQAACEHALSLIQGVQNYEEIADADLVIEAVFEQMSVKEAVFRQLDQVMKPGAILASNTSTLDLNLIASFTSRPSDVIGLHFFSPANVMELLEVVRGRETSAEVLNTALKLAKRIKKTAVVAGVCDGFIGNRMLAQYTKQAAFLLEEGCTPQQVDTAIERFGFAMGPFRMSDLAGNDISWAVRKARKLSKPDEIYSALGDLLCEAGRFGQKTKAGWYDYQDNDRTAYPSEFVLVLIRQHALEQGYAQREVGDEEIVQRLVLALANEGRKIVEEGIAARASDVDVVYLKGYGFPKHRGGPMFYAQTLGWETVSQKLREFASGHRGETWVF